MKRLLPLIYFLLFTVASAWCQTEPAGYVAAIGRFTKFYNSNQPDSIYKMFGAEMRKSVPEDQFKATLGAMQTQLGSLTKTTLIGYIQPVAQYSGSFQKAVLLISLSLNEQRQIIGLLLSQPPTAAAAKADNAVGMDASLTESPVFLKTLGGTVSGTLTMPKPTGGKVPIVLIIAGSGPTDRDGNSAKLGLTAYSYKLLANELGKAGIASLRYDKRMVGQSSANHKEDDLHIEDYIDDATSLILMLHDDQRFSKIVVLGHSEGSLVGMNASFDEPVNGFISVAGAGEGADKILNEQMKSEPGYKADAYKAIVDSLRKGKLTPRVDPSLYALARPSIQPYLMSWFRHDPARDLKKLKIPVLILQGTNDVQVTVAQAEKLKKAKSDAVLTIIPGMNHILKEAPADRAQNLATYSNPSLPLKPELVTAIVGFVEKVKAP